MALAKERWRLQEMGRCETNEVKLMRREFSDLGTCPFHISADGLQTSRILYRSFDFLITFSMEKSCCLDGIYIFWTRREWEPETILQGSYESGPWHSILGQLPHSLVLLDLLAGHTHRTLLPHISQIHRSPPHKQDEPLC